MRLCPPKYDAILALSTRLGSTRFIMSNDASVNKMKIGDSKVGFLFDSKWRLIGIIDRTSAMSSVYGTLKDTIKSLNDIKSEADAFDLIDQRTSNFKQVRDIVAKAGGHSISSEA